MGKLFAIIEDMTFYQKFKKFFHLFFNIPEPYPSDIQIEVTNRCNFSCKMCPRKLVHAGKEDMPWETFKKSIDSLENPQTITLTGWGEPLLCKEFHRMIKYLNQKLPKTKIKLTTNGSLANKEWIKKLLKLNIHEISFSIDAIEKNALGHQNNKQIINNIKNLVKARGSEVLPYLCLQAVVRRNGYRDLEDVIRFAAQNNIGKINLVRLIKYPGGNLSRPSWQREQRMIRRAKKLARKLKIKFLCLNQFNLFRYLASRNDKKCLRNDNHLYITSSGKITPCCNLRSQICGDLYKESLQKIWKNKKFQYFRSNQEKICAFCDGLSFKQKL